MSERKYATNKKNSNRVKAKDRALYTSMQKSYHRKKEKPAELTQNLFT